MIQSNYNKLYNLAIPFLAFLFTTIACKKNSLEVSSIAFIIPDSTTKIVLGNIDTARIKIYWNKAQWTITTDTSSGFIKSLSQDAGGSVDSSHKFTNVRLKMTYNVTGASRSQDLTLKNIQTGDVTTIKLTQNSYNNADTVTITPSTLYQKITGFGGMLNPPTWVGNDKLTIADIDKLYGSNGLGFNILRMMLYPDSSNWGNDIAIATEAQNKGAILFATPWTPPVSMKSNGVNNNIKGDSLLPSKYADFAAHIKSFVQYTKSKGVNLYAVSVQNEPDYKVDYDGCSYTPQQMLSFVKNYGRSVGDVKLIAGETVQFNTAYTDPILSDATAVNNFDIVGTHLYGGGIKNYTLATQHSKEIWMTEHLFNDSVNGVSSWQWIPSITATIATELHQCMINNFNAYVWWYLRRYYSFVGDTDTRSLVANGELSKRAYIMAHYAKYATGKTRVGAVVRGTSGILSTAYYGNGEASVVLTNVRSLPLKISLSYPSAVSSVSAVQTSATSNMESIATSLSADKKIITVTIMPQSIVSLKIQP